MHKMQIKAHKMQMKANIMLNNITKMHTIVILMLIIVIRILKIMLIVNIAKEMELEVKVLLIKIFLINLIGGFLNKILKINKIQTKLLAIIKIV